MSIPLPPSIIAFEGHRLIASGVPADVALALRRVCDRGPNAPVLAFDAATSMPVEFDLRGSAEDILARVAARSAQPGSEKSAESAEPRKAGRPKLGVVGREVTLLPRHWDWLASQPGGASVVLRKLVDQARKTSVDNDLRRGLMETAYRFMSAIAGNLPDFEEASRALFADDLARFDALIESWPVDVRDHLHMLTGRGEEKSDEGQAA